MNDIHAMSVDWQEFVGRFETGGISARMMVAIGNRDVGEASSMAQDYLGFFLWRSDQGEEESNPTTLGFHRLGALVRFYQDLRSTLPGSVQVSFDQLLAPFVGGWMKLGPSLTQKLDLPPDMQALRYGGLSSAIDPAHCDQIAASLPDDWESWLSRGPESSDRQVAVEEIKELVNLVKTASSRRQGVIAVAEI